MGGSVGVTIRRSNGVEHRMCRWTNSMPWGITNIGMMTENDDHIAEYLKVWNEMVDDYDRNKESGIFENNMTTCYAPRPFLAPSEYGLVVVDFKNNVILSNQGYTSLDKISLYNVKIDLTDKGCDLSTLDDGMNGKDDVERLGGFSQAGKIKKFKFVDINHKPIKDGEVFVATFYINTDPLRFEDFFSEGIAGWKRMRERVMELGFKLSDTENEKWDTYINEREDAE